jgi:hypothetical protein
MSKQVFKNNKFGIAMRTLLITMILSLIFSSITFAGRYKTGDAWSFGVNGDTQWTVVDPATGLPADPTGANPDRVSAALARVVDAKFRDAKVKFVIQTGDLTDYAGPGLFTRAKVAKEDLYDKGIGFFPLRGNHETYGYFIKDYDPNYDLNVPDFKKAFPQTQGLDFTFGATNFSSPSAIDTVVYDNTGKVVNVTNTTTPATHNRGIINGLSYSFDYGTAGSNARFVMVDTEQTAVVHQNQPKNVVISNVNVINKDGSITVQNITIDEGYYYVGFVVYQYSKPISGRVTLWNGVEPKSNYKNWSSVAGTIPAGSWFRVDSAGRPSTHMYGWEQFGGAWPVYKADGTTDWTYLTTETNNANSTEFWPGAQQDWITGRLAKATRGTEHAFVFSHRPMLNGNHTDSFFGANSYLTPVDQDTFFASLEDNGVRFMISGHDHLYNRALVESPGLASEVMQIVTQGLSTKFYTPTRLDDFGKDGVDPNKTWVKNRETQISQEVNNFGYYIYTVDGPRVTANYYADKKGGYVDGDLYPDGSGSLKVPNLTFAKQDEWGYSLNGQQFVIIQGGSYTDVQDKFGNTTAKIIAGINNSTTKDLTPVGYVDLNNPQTTDPNDDTLVSAPRKLNKVVNTGWVARPGYLELPAVKTFKDLFKLLQVLMSNAHNKIQSDVMSIWGMGEFGKKEGELDYDQTDTYVMQMSYDTTSMYYGIENMMMIKNGKAGIATYVNGKWVNAIDENFGGVKKFVLGKYDSTKNYPLGTYGIDLKTNTAWAVLNYNADFAVATNVGPACFKK